MQVDIVFDFAKVYNIDRADVAQGQKFELLTDYENGRWLSEYDEVLSMKVNGKDAKLQALEVGVSTIVITDQALAIQKQITINVVEKIEPMAASLNVTAGEPVRK
jgi:hypothetical protein